HEMTSEIQLTHYSTFNTGFQGRCVTGAHKRRPYSLGGSLGGRYPRRSGDRRSAIIGNPQGSRRRPLSLRRADAAKRREPVTRTQLGWQRQFRLQLEEMMRSLTGSSAPANRSLDALQEIKNKEIQHAKTRICTYFGVSACGRIRDGRNRENTEDGFL